MNSLPSRPAAESPRPAAEGVEDSPRIYLSSLVDGEAGAADRACAAWRQDADARRAWHAYHLIGDVMRAEDLANCPRRDADFLAGVRARLRHEPVPLAPRPRERPPRWVLPAAAATAFLLVGAVLVLAARGTGDDAAGWVQLAGARGGPAATLVGAPAASSAVTPAGVVIRDARLDEYLRAHQAARGGVAMPAPGGTLRRVDTAAPGVTER